ncbi:SusC/RagA family TonB-linked outer membrane protein [Plebeiibacterium sediminum]|uniref:Ig-like domain-containing protein n=1 Tax=Plebeiibacterium sediminum TaxID=2992112 RepID=A0AAE3M3V7_9BACT|nr:SusC/RagA family TonB-linked outer membrane protein [Plebeiobacterium sediminum]MCW3786320.1 Ig-like domain-containing protein [Plebeiobacterium sediminum]
MEKKYINKLLILCVIVLVQYATAVAQKGEVPTSLVTAKILDDNNNPVTNIVVTSFVAKNKAVTDVDGKFKINVAAGSTDHLYIAARGYKPLVIKIENGLLNDSLLKLKPELIIDGERELEFPYQKMTMDRSVSSSTYVSGEELSTYPTTVFLEALSGRVPGMVVEQNSATPGAESIFVSVRGVAASTYIDGVLRDASDLSVDEVEGVHVIRDLAGRAILGLSGTNPVIWITTKKGISYKHEINASASVGINTPVGLPEYLDAYDYATLVNEGRNNDGLSSIYSSAVLDAYKNNTDPIKYPNIDYQDEYVKKRSMFRKANVNFRGGDENVNYFSMLDYIGTDGLEAVGQDMKYNRYKIRGNVNIRMNDWLKMNVNLSAVYGKRKYANDGSGAEPYDMFYDMFNMPSNAHPISYEDKLIISDNYPTNITNELKYSGYAESAQFNTQNSADLIINLGNVLKGLTFKTSAAFDVNNMITNNKGGTADLFRLIDNNGELDVERIVEAQVDPNLSEGGNNYLRRTSANGQFTYDRTFDKHALTMNASYFQLLEEIRNTSANYQPLKRQDLGFRANYAYDGKYVAEVDLSYTGSMFLKEDNRFDLYPTFGAGWIMSKEDFLADSRVVDYLKLYSSYGKMGIEYVGLAGFNSYYLFETLWQQQGTWESGIEGNKGNAVNIYNIMQAGSSDFELPVVQFFNVGIQSNLFDNKLAFEANYYSRKETKHFSLKQYETPSLYGGYDFLPASNFGERKYWGIDGLIQYSDKIGDFKYSIGANATYNRGKIVVIDEPLALEEYRKMSGKEMDNIWGLQSEGLFQSEEEIESRVVSQSWGALQPGDIKYSDYNNDNVVDEKDRHDLGEHSPRIYYGVNLALEYKGVGLKVIGTGRMDGKMSYLNSPYFTVMGTSSNYTKPMLDRYPYTNDYPRLTVQSTNNYQSSSYWLKDASYFMLKNIELSYTLPKISSRKILMDEFKIFVQGKNLFTVSDLTKYGLHPENLYAGISGYPLLRTVTVGFTCKF